MPGGYTLSYSSNTKLCELPGAPEAPAFEELYTKVKQHLRDQSDDSIGLLGPGRGCSEKSFRARAFGSWVINYLDSGIGQKYWGPTAPGKWRLGRDRATVAKFFRSLVMGLAALERKRRRTEGVASVGQDEVEGQQDDEDGWDEPYGSEYESVDDEDLEDEDWKSHQLPLSSTKSLPVQGNLHKSSRNTEVRNSVNRAPLSNVTPAFPVRKHPREGGPSCSSKRLRQSEFVPRKTTGRPSAVRRSDPTLEPPPYSGGERVFETRLGDDKTVAFLFAQPTISFENFLSSFCDVWKRDIAEIDAKNVLVKISMSGVGDYQLSFGLHRRKSWLHIMKIAEIVPDSNILVTIYDI